ncbi:MAG: hypothetical protein WC044_10830 [Crocinitomicaceae bacterium]
MKKLILFSLLIVVALFSCKKLNKLTQFNLTYDESITIPSNSAINLPFVIQTPDMTTNSESTFEVNDTRKDLIQEIKLTQMVLTVNTPASGNYNFLKDIILYINADGLDEVKLAWQENIPNDSAKQLTLNVSNADIKEFIKKDKFNLRVVTTTDEVITTDYKIDLHYVLFVDAKLKK